MKIGKDVITTALGAVMAAGMSAQPIINASSGTFHQADWIQLAVAIATAVFGFFTNKGSVSDQK